VRRRATTTTLATGTAAAALAAALGGALPAASSPGTPTAVAAPSGSYRVGLLGDMPYGAYGRALYPNVIKDINHSDVAFSIFDGDIKNGSEPCYAAPHEHVLPSGVAHTAEGALARERYTGIRNYRVGQDVYFYALDLFKRYEKPVVYLPGDNEWTDCDRDVAKLSPPDQADSVDRLNYLRRLAYPTAQSLGQSTLRLERQSAQYPENVRWSRGPVTFVGLNVTGSDNNWVDDTAAAQKKDGPAAEAQREYTARNRANLAWIRQAFRAARQAGSRGIMISMQADMWDPAAVQTHFADTKAELVRQTTHFAGQVVLVNGDSHSFEMDKPLTDYATTNAAGGAGGNVIQNFTRVTTFGEAQYHWVSATIDPADPMVFRFDQHLVAADVPTYTQPPPAA